MGYLCIFLLIKEVATEGYFNISCTVLNLWIMHLFYSVCKQHQKQQSSLHDNKDSEGAKVTLETQGPVILLKSLK